MGFILDLKRLRTTELWAMFQLNIIRVYRCGEYSYFCHNERMMI